MCEIKCQKVELFGPKVVVGHRPPPAPRPPAQARAGLGEEAQSDLQRGLQDELLQVLRILLGEREECEEKFIQEVSNKVEWVSFSLGRRKVFITKKYI